MEACHNVPDDVPPLHSLQRDPDLATSVSQLLAHYDQHFKESMAQAEPPSAQHYNTQDTCISEPAMRRPNEGVVGGANKRRLA